MLFLTHLQCFRRVQRHAHAIAHLICRSLLFNFKKRAGEHFHLPPTCMPVSVAEYASASLNIPKYPWKSLKKLFWLWQGFEYSSSSYMFDRLLKIPQILNVPGFWIRHGCVSKGYTESWICLYIAQYASIMPECLNMLQCLLICTNIAEYYWMSLNMPENFWINCSDCVRVLNMHHHLRCLTKFLMCHRH